MIFWDRAFVSNQVLKVRYFFQILLLQAFNVGLRDLHIALKLEDVDEELPFVGEFFLEDLDLIRSAWVSQVLDHVEVHSVLVGLLHDLCHFLVQLVDKRPSRMVNDLIEGLQTHSSFAYIPVKKSYANHDVGQLAELSHFFRRG